jgi:AMP-polyphosphate phosphotransferase
MEMDMLDQLDLDLKLGKEAYRAALPDFQARLYDMSQAIFETRRPVILLFEGWAGTSKVSTISALTRRLDPRGIRVYPITSPRTYETQYPWLYRFWLKIPSYGQIAIFDRSWYREVLAARDSGNADAQFWRSRCEDITAFERQLTDDGTVLLKFWLHISRKEQGRRFKRLLADKLTAWQVTEEDRQQHKHYERYATAVEDLIARTDTASAPWHLIPATDTYFARATIFKTIIATLEAQLGRTAVALPPNAQHAGLDDSGPALRRRAIESRATGGTGGGHMTAVPSVLDADNYQADNATAQAQEQGIGTAVLSVPSVAKVGILQRVDLSLRLDEKVYNQQLKQLQAKLHLLGLEIYHQQRPVVLVFEGWDAAGKGGSIQRLVQELDPRGYVVHAIAAPSGDDKIRHYLYRFWRRLPPRGQIGIFDRSWYGRVLVERIEGFARHDEWQRAYGEINEFERQLAEYGTIICKFWLHLSPDEQLRRFEERQNVPYKAWKLTDEDWRNREKWPQYELAADEMLVRTSTPTAPWTVVESEDKRFARVKVLRTVVQRLESELGRVKL